MKWIGVILITLMLASVAIADLSEFPNNFIDKGEFNGQIIIGDKASPTDFFSATELALSLQYELMNKPKICAAETSTATESSEVYQIKKSGDMLEASEGFNTVVPTITENEFSLLASSSVKNSKGTFEYKQFLNFGPEGDTGKTAFTHALGVPEDPLEIPGSYFVYDAGVPVYEYQILFSTPLESDIDTAANGYELSDLTDKKITILGKSYNIIETAHPAKDSIEITLLGGSVTDLLEEFQTKTYSMDNADYEIEVVAIYYKTGVIKTRFKVNGELTNVLGVGETFALSDGTEIGVKQLLENEGSESKGDLVEFYLGAKKLILKDTNTSDRAYGGSEYEIGSDSVQGTDVNIIAIDPGLVAGDTYKIESISVKWTPEETHYVAGGKGLLDIVEDKNQLFTANFDIFFEGMIMENNMELINLEPVKDDQYNLKFYNKAEKELSIPLFNYNLNRFGDEDHELIVDEGDAISKKEYFVVTSDGGAGIPNAKGYTHLIQYTGQDVSENTVEFKDLSTDETILVSYEQGTNTANLILNNNPYKFNFSDAANDGDINVDLDNDGTINAGEIPVLVTMYGANIELITEDDTFFPGGAYSQIQIYSKEKESDVAASSLHQGLYMVLAPTFQVYWNNALAAGTGVTLATNPLLNSEPISKFHDMVRVSVKQDGDELDIENVERCIDMANKEQFMAAVSTTDDATIATSGLPYDTLGEYLYNFYLNAPAISPAPGITVGGCLLTFTEDNRFMWNVMETDNEMGATSWPMLAQRVGKDSGADSLSVISFENQGEQKLYIKSRSSQVVSYDSEVKATSDVDSKIRTPIVDKDVKTMEQNMILIGGPCSNKISAKLLGNPIDCAAEYESGKGRIKVVDNNGYKAIIVSGYDKEDTYLAAKALAGFSTNGISGMDLQVTGVSSMPIIGPYEIPTKTNQPAQPVKQVKQEVVEKVVEEVVEENNLDCPGANPTTLEYSTQIKKFGVTKDVDSKAIVKSEGLKAIVSYENGQTFEAQMGVDWLQTVVHIHKGTCDGEEISALTFKWEDGDKDKREEIALPEAGCYCAKISNADVSIDNADISMTSGDFSVAEFYAN